MSVETFKAHAQTSMNLTRVAYDLKLRSFERFEDYWRQKDVSWIPETLFSKDKKVWLEIGAGSGWFFIQMAKLNPSIQLVAIERSKMRGSRLVKRAARSGAENLAAFRGNAIPWMISAIPTECLDRIYILYPCPWTRNSQRKHRWYLHPIMRHMVRALKPGGQMIWASDQKFYIDEAAFVSEKQYGFKILKHGKLEPNEYNDLAQFPNGRTKFELTFKNSGQDCFELIAEKA